MGTLAAATVLVIGIGVGPAGAMDRLPGPWSRGRTHDVVRDRDHHEEREDRCDVVPAPTVTTTTVAVPTGGASVTQNVTVVVPPVVRVQSDGHGVLKVVTNAARPPAQGDLVYLRQVDGTYVPADPALVQRVMTARWAGGSWCSTTAEHRSIR